MTSRGRRILLVQFAGDYRKALRDLESGEGEQYYAQRYSVESTASLSELADEVSLLCLYSEEVYDEVLPNGVRAIGAGLQRGRGIREAIATIERVGPTHLVLLTPEWVVAAWALVRGIALLPLFADSFQRTRFDPRSIRGAAHAIREGLRLRLLGATLASDRVRWVGNHNVSASESLARLGVAPAKIVPWDWPPMVSPDDHAPKSAPRGRSWVLLFVGMLEPSKGLGDAIDAIAILRRADREVRLVAIGRGDEAPYRAAIARHGIADRVELLGGRSHEEVVRRFREADVALVPSRHEYPEGLPMTIYESFATRTPLVCSDHPMFVDRVRSDAIVFPQGDAHALAERIETLMHDPNLYESLSRGGADAWRRLLCPTRPIDIIRGFLVDSPADRAMLGAASLASSGGPR